MKKKKRKNNNIKKKKKRSGWRLRGFGADTVIGTVNRFPFGWLSSSRSRVRSVCRTRNRWLFCCYIATTILPVASIPRQRPLPLFLFFSSFLSFSFWLWTEASLFRYRQQTTPLNKKKKKKGEEGRTGHSGWRHLMTGCAVDARDRIEREDPTADGHSSFFSNSPLAVFSLLLMMDGDDFQVFFVFFFVFLFLMNSWERDREGERLRSCF